MKVEPIAWQLQEHKNAVDAHLYPVIHESKGKFQVRWMGERLSIGGEWDWEPMPSGRDEEYIRSHSFDSLEQAERTARENWPPPGFPAPGNEV